ncbi:MAG TPA: class I SAM-dependent methyltransferase [Myxococcota bacterium]|nr:class I SAM-dependent methyltransferase [Myxococcota bacterium]HRY92643.1 class I SAM-dependent methyltransferase [Myxococcota bacterium]HSA22810.1 class I SAM-dependent methyltransferase [Myxococcota bacterium]
MKTRLSILSAAAGCLALVFAFVFFGGPTGHELPMTLWAALGSAILSAACLAAVLLLAVRDQAKIRQATLTLLRKILKLEEYHADALRRMSHNLDLVRTVVVNHLAHDHLANQVVASVREGVDRIEGRIQGQTLAAERAREELLAAVLRLRLDAMERLKDMAVLESVAQLQAGMSSAAEHLEAALAVQGTVQQDRFLQLGSEQAALERKLTQGLDALLAGLKGQTAASENEYRQLEALLQLQRVLPGDTPLPPFRDWAISPDFALSLAGLLLTHRPGLVVELGSGLSSLVIGMMLRRIGRGQLLSLESDATFAARTRQQIALAGLEDRVEVRHAPLREHRLQGETWAWYDFSADALGEPIDLLVVDGPPRTVHPLVRYPAVPVLHGKLSPKAIVLLDDARREGETQVVARWQREFPEFELELLPHEKGTAVLRRRA